MTYVIRLVVTYMFLIIYIIIFFKRNYKIRDITDKLTKCPNILILIYLAIVAISTLISPYLDLQNSIQLQRISANFIQIVIFIIVSIMARRTLSESDFVRLFSLGIVAGTIASLAGLAFAPNLEYLPGRLGHPAYHPVSVGVWSCFSSLLILSGNILRRGMLLWVIILFFMIITFLAFSKAAFIALLITVAFSLIFSRSWWSINYLLSASLCALLFTWPLLLDNFEHYTTAGYLETLTGRTWIWKWTWNMILERPLIGYGYKIFQDVMKIHEGYNISNAHNLILDVIFTSGFAGASIYFVWLLSSFLIALRSRNIFIISIFVFFIIRSVTESGLNLLDDFIVIFPLTLINRH